MQAAAVPLAAVAAGPLLLADLPFGAAGTRWWRAWTASWVAAVLALAASALWAPPRPVLPPAAIVTGVALVGSLVFCAIGWRHLSLYRVGRQRISLLVGVTFIALGVVGALVGELRIPASLALVVMAVDIGLSLTAIGGMAAISLRPQNVPEVMAPIINREPLIALRLGLDPAVIDFVRLVGNKDPSTRAHIIRVGELTMRVGIRAGIRGAKLRQLGIGALLHDVGKLVVPDDVLRKPGVLTDEEFELIKQHSTAGERLLAPSQVLATSAKYVRWHHERPDGTGYPDGLSGDQIPLDVALLSVCDAYDAMTQDRHYRTAMPPAQALAILQEHSGTQFDPEAVQLLRAELAANPQGATVFTSLSDTATDDSQSGCAHALPGG